MVVKIYMLQKYTTKNMVLPTSNVFQKVNLRHHNKHRTQFNNCATIWNLTIKQFVIERWRNAVPVKPNSPQSVLFEREYGKSVKHIVSERGDEGGEGGGVIEVNYVKQLIEITFLGGKECTLKLNTGTLYRQDYWIPVGGKCNPSFKKKYLGHWSPDLILITVTFTLERVSNKTVDSF